VFRRAKQPNFSRNIPIDPESSKLQIFIEALGQAIPQVTIFNVPTQCRGKPVLAI
jgi:hypothetical protein